MRHSTGPARRRIYIDGGAIEAHALICGDPSLNWLDLQALAAGFGAPVLPDSIVWFSPGDLPDRSRREALARYARALRAAGVDCRTSTEPGDERECLRCGHGWTDPAAPALDLAFAVLGDAAEDAFDEAFVLAAPPVRSGLSGLMTKLYPVKRLTSVQLGATTRLRPPAGIRVLSREMLASARLPLAMPTADGGRIRQPACWRTPLSATGRFTELAM